MRLVELGVIGKAHGYRGEFIAHTDSGRGSALEKASQLFVGNTADSALPYKVLSASWMPKGWKLKLAGIETEELVKSLRGNTLYLNRCDLPPTDENEFYLGDLVGCLVRDLDSDSDLGRCVGVESTPQAGMSAFQDRWLVECANGETLNVPAVRRFVAKVDVDLRVIWLRNLSDLK